MTRPANVHNPFDWKRSQIIDLYLIDCINAEQRDKALRIVEADEQADRRQGEAELATVLDDRDQRSWWKKLLG